MRILTGLLLLLAGIAVVSYSLPSSDSERTLAQVTQIAVPQAPAPAPAPSRVAQASQTPRTFSPQQPLYTSPPAGEGTRATHLPAATASQPGAPTAQAGWKGQARPDDADARRELASALQRQLRRVGCYDGEVNGVWGATSRKAMAAFTDRVNASLPVEEPDYILLTLVRGHATQACGKSCPTGQSYSEDGRCVATPVLAARQGARTKTAAAPPSPRKTTQPEPAPAHGSPAHGTWSTTTVAAAPPPTPLPGRMAMGAATPSEPAASEAIPRPRPITAAEARRQAQPLVPPPAPNGGVQSVDANAGAAVLDRNARLEQERAARIAAEERQRMALGAPPPAGAMVVDETGAPVDRRAAEGPAPGPVVVYRAPPPPRYVPPYGLTGSAGPKPATYYKPSRAWRSKVFDGSNAH